jgi:hypothetical protein
MPVLDKMPSPPPNYRFLFTDPSQVNEVLSGNMVTLYNRALVQMNGELYLIGDTSDCVRDYISQWPKEVQEQLAKNRAETSEPVPQSRATTIAANICETDQHDIDELSSPELDEEEIGDDGL